MAPYEFLMEGQSQLREARSRRLPARDVIDAVLENMRQNLEPLKYSTLAPCRYLVYLHADEYARLEGIVPILQEQTVRALTEEVGALNRRTVLHRYADRLLGRDLPPVHNAGLEWQVEFLQDPDGTVAPGDILVDSELLLPAAPELGVGERTRRITTLHIGSRVVTKQHLQTSSVDVPARQASAMDIAEKPSVAPFVRRTAAATERAGARVLARIDYEDDAGRHSHAMVKESVSVGRGGTAYPVDIRLTTCVDISREHARIRRDPQTGRFFLIDLSSLGTTLDGRPVPRGYEEVDGTKRENGVEAQLPERARIGLADAVFLDFQALP